MGETILMEGHLALKDFDYSDADEFKTDRVYCITYVDSDDQYDLMLLWRRGDVIRSRSIYGAPNQLMKTDSDVLLFAKFVGNAYRLLGGD